MFSAISVELSKNNIFNAKHYAWLVWSLASLFLFYKYLLQVSPSIVVDELMIKYQLSAEQLGNMVAYYFYAYMFMQLPGGILLDRITLRILLPIAIFICALGALVFAYSNHLLLAKLGRILIGLGGSFSAIGTMKLISLYFSRKDFSWAAGLMMSFGMIGAVGGQGPLAYFSDTIGWQKTLYLSAIIGFVLSLIMFFTLKYGKDIQHRKDIPTNSFSLTKQLTEIISSSQNWYLALFSGIAFAPVSAFAGLWGVPFLKMKLNISNIESGAITSLVFIGFAIGCPFSGILSNKLKQRKSIMCIGTLIGSICLFAILLIPGLSKLSSSILIFLFGFFTSFFFISFTMIKEANVILLSGTAIGFINTFNALFGAISEPGIGRLIDHFASSQGEILPKLFIYQKSLLVLPIGMLLALIMALFIKDTYKTGH